MFQNLLKSRLSITALAAVALAGSSAAPGFAQDREIAPETPPVIDRLFDCRTIAEPEARLACFDREVGAVYEARQSRELVIAERQDVDEAKRGLFGLTLPKIRLFGGGGEDSAELDEITATLASAQKRSNGLYIFELEDGARWVQTEKRSGYSRYSAGDTIVISRGALGSFKAKINGGRAIRVRRTN